MFLLLFYFIIRGKNSNSTSRGMDALHSTSEVSVLSSLLYSVLSSVLSGVYCSMSGLSDVVSLSCSELHWS